MTRAEQEAKLESLEWIARYWAGRYARTAAEREDLLQEGRIAIWRAVATWREDGGASLNSFVTVRVRGTLLSILRTRGYTEARMVSLDDPNSSPALPAVEATQDVSSSSEWAASRLHEPLKRLPFMERVAITGRLNDLTLDEISRELHVTRQAVRANEVSALRKLKVLVKPDADERTTTGILHRAMGPHTRRRK